MIMIKKIILYTVFAFFVSTLSVYVTQSKMKSDESISKSNSLLYDIDDLMNALNYFSKADNSSEFFQEARKIIETIVVKKIIVIATLKPEVEKLQGVPLEALIQVIEYKKHPGFKSFFAKEITDEALSYVMSMEDKVIEKSKRPVNILKASERERLGLPKRQ